MNLEGVTSFGKMPILSEAGSKMSQRWIVPVSKNMLKSLKTTTRQAVSEDILIWWRN